MKYVIIDFPIDQAPAKVENFFEAESAPFIQAFNAYGSTQVSNMSMYLSNFELNNHFLKAGFFYIIIVNIFD